MPSLKILHTVNSVGSTSFGFGQVSVSLAKSQYVQGLDVTIWCLDNQESIRWASANHELPVDVFRGFKLFGPKSLWFSPALTRQAAQNSAGKFDIIHQHGIWTGISNASLQFSRNKGTPVVIAPHGTLDKWAMNSSRFKKKIALAVYENANLRMASCLHATSENEIDEFRNIGLKNPIAYIENGIQPKFLSKEGTAERFRKLYSISADKRILFFLSRISPKKGLLMLVEAIFSLRSDFADWQLVIAGIDESNHLKDVVALIDQLELTESVKVTGTLFGQDKSDAFAAAELFILPSYSEGFPMVVLDSLAAGVPVITTKASSWSDLEEHNCGWWTDINTGAIAKALKEALNMSSEQLSGMGKNAKVLIALKYTWPRLAQKTIHLYNWLLGKIDKPDFVITD
jgi:glycosyltransferase involved in cell wall biosynthesis